MVVQLWCDGGVEGRAKICGNALKHHAHTFDAEVDGDGDENCVHVTTLMIDGSCRIFEKCSKCGFIPTNMRLR